MNKSTWGWVKETMDPRLAMPSDISAAEDGFAISFHGLRHSAAILLLTSGVDMKTAAASRAQPGPALEPYAHFVPSAGREAADRLAGVLAFWRSV